MRAYMQGCAHSNARRDECEHDCTHMCLAHALGIGTGMCVASSPPSALEQPPTPLPPPPHCLPVLNVFGIGVNALGLQQRHHGSFMSVLSSPYQGSVPVCAKHVVHEHAQ